MNVSTKIQILDDTGEKFFGEGPCRLLHLVEETGSLRSAAASMGMAYSKALRLIQHAEAALGFPLTQRCAGGKSGGGSVLTPEGRAFLHQYEAYRDACVSANRSLFGRCFPSVGCVIMASGMGKRFGGNKLMADFRGQPMIARALDATEGLLLNRVVVTRHEDVASFCRERGVKALVHDLPGRNDTVRLGLEALGNMDGCLFCPGDQPLLRRDSVRALLDAWREEPDCIWRLTYLDQPGTPILFPRWALPELAQLPEGKGGRFVVNKYPERVRGVPARDRYELMDADTPEDLAFLVEQ